jgi:hypothetical protein
MLECNMKDGEKGHPFQQGCEKKEYPFQLQSIVTNAIAFLVISEGQRVSTSSASTSLLNYYVYVRLAVIFLQRLSWYTFSTTGLWPSDGVILVFAQSISSFLHRNPFGTLILTISPRFLRLRFQHLAHIICIFTVGIVFGFNVINP